MSLAKILSISGSALQAQSQRLNAVASNLANVDASAPQGEQPYRARQVVFEADARLGAGNDAPGVRATAVQEDPSPARRVYSPGHPHADAEGYVSMSNVNPVEQMVDMIAASRAYQNNIEVMNTAKSLLAKTLTLGT